MIHTYSTHSSYFYITEIFKHISEWSRKIPYATKKPQLKISVLQLPSTSYLRPVLHILFVPVCQPLSVCLSVCQPLSVCMYVCQSACMSVCLSISLYVCQSLSVCVSVCQSGVCSCVSFVWSVLNVAMCPLSLLVL